MAQTICLNMIVKNESGIIEYTLDKLLNKIKIDYYVIVDTGSSDNTKEIIKNFFNKKNIPGEIYDDTWIDFASNRTMALSYAFNKSDYVLIFDADDEIIGDFILPDKLVYDGYKFLFNIDMVSFQRTLLVSNRKKWEYKSVIHEYIVNCELINKIETIEGKYFVTTTQISYRNLDSDKYLNDALILEKSFENVYQKYNDINLASRYSFYCANSYFNHGDFNQAIKWYLKRLEFDGYTQEKYVSCIKLYYCYDQIDLLDNNSTNNDEKKIYYLKKSIEFDNKRVEGIFELIKFYCLKDQFDIAFQYYLLINKLYDSDFDIILNTKLFINIPIYTFYLPFLIIIISMKFKNYQLGIQMYKIIFMKKQVNINHDWLDKLINNLYFFTDHFKNNIEFKELLESYVNFYNLRF